MSTTCEKWFAKSSSGTMFTLVSGYPWSCDRPDSEPSNNSLEGSYRVGIARKSAECEQYELNNLTLANTSYTLLGLECFYTVTRFINLETIKFVNLETCE